MKLLFISYVILSVNLSFAQLSDFKSTDFTKANNIAELNQGHSLDNLPLLAHKLTSKLDTNVEKFRAIYLWVCKNITVDSNQGNKVLNKRKKLKNDSLTYKKWNNDYKKITFKRLLKHKKTMCTGYAYLIKELCFLANIESEIIDGYARTSTTNTEELNFANHSWNAVKLNNKWYLCDAIWASGYSQNGRFIKTYNDGYFLTDPLLFALNHYPLKKEWLLNEQLIQSDFYAAPVVYEETFKHKILPTYPKTLVTEVKKDTDINFSYKTLDDLEHKNIKLIQYFRKKELSFDIYNLKKEGGVTSFTSKIKFKGVYDLHLKIENDIVATYTFKVVK